MFTSSVDNSPITPAESTRHSWELEASREARDHDIKSREMELKVLRLQTNWGSLLQLPTLIIRLPLLMLLGIGFIVAMIRGVDPGQSFWDIVKGV